MVKGPSKRYTLTSAKGNETHRIFCSDCGSSIANTSNDGKDFDFDYGGGTGDEAEGEILY